jgi:hypothetical protein
MITLANASECLGIKVFACRKEMVKKFLNFGKWYTNPSYYTIRIVISGLSSNYIYSIILDFLVKKWILY